MTEKENKKATKQAKKFDKDNLVKLAMDMASRQGWETLTLSDIAGEAEIPLADLHAVFEDKTDILVALGRIIDRKTLENVGEQHPETSVRDALFDVLMERFDILNEYRGGVISVLQSFRFDPKQAVIGLPHLCRSMTWMAEAAGVDTNGFKGAAKVAGLTGVYLKVLKSWAKDESEDLAQTMASLDKALNRAEQVVNTLGL